VADACLSWSANSEGHEIPRTLTTHICYGRPGPRPGPKSESESAVGAEPATDSEAAAAQPAGGLHRDGPIMMHRLTRTRRPGRSEPSRAELRIMTIAVTVTVTVIMMTPPSR
jgi:hypothetical protein